MTPLEGEHYRTALLELLGTESFQRSPALGRLLSYLVEQVLAGEAGTLKESVIGHVLYSRPAGYDPKLDSLVRVSANRLRSRMEEHYRRHPDTRVRLVLPKGSYVPLLEILESPPPVDVSHPDQSGPVDGIFPASTTASGNTFHPAGHGDAASGLSGFRLYARAHKAQVAFFSVLVAVAVLGLLFHLLQRRSNATAPSTAWNVRPFARLGGSQQFGAFSPDGKSLAFTSTTTQDDNKAIYIQALESEDARRIAAGARPAWSPDGKRLAFLRPEANGKKLIILHTLATGAETTLTEVEARGPWLCQMPRLSWSPDGSTLYTSARTGLSLVCGIVVIDVSTSNVSALIPPETSVGDLEADVSPDGSMVAFMRGLGMGASDIFVASSHGGEVHRVTYDGADLLGFDWSTDGKAVIVASGREGVKKLWRAPVAGGPMQALTDGATGATFPSVNPHSKQINFTQFHTIAPIWKSVAGTISEILDNQSRNFDPTISPDGKTMLFASDRNGRPEQWLSQADGSHSRPLLANSPFQSGLARWSPDGSQIAMECQVDRRSHICLIRADGSGLRQLTDGNASEFHPTWSHDGKFLYFGSDRTIPGEVYRMEIATGTTTQLTRQGAYRAIESVDGNWIYAGRGQPQGGMVILPAHGSEQEWRAAENDPMLLELGPNTSTDWDVCKEGVVYRAPADNSPPQIDLFDPRTRKSRRLFVLRDLPAGTELSISVSPDGQTILYAAANTHSELSIMVPR
ncbi:MAG TPA: hypothetical protein VGN16_11150 [Acidobacteriaceae bacterium]